MTSATLAQCFEFALRFGTVGRAKVTAWADHQIAKAEKPKLWLIELSTAPEREIESYLREVSGERDASEALNQFLGHVNQLWHSSDLSIGKLRGIAWILHCDELLPAPGGEADWGVALEVEGEGLDEGWTSEARFRDYASKSLKQYARFTEFVEVLATLKNRREQDAAEQPATRL